MSPLVGASLKRKEDRRLLTGAGRYVDDIAPPGTAHVALVRSPHAHARLTRIDTARAEAAGRSRGAHREERAGARRRGAARRPDPAHRPRPRRVSLRRHYGVRIDRLPVTPRRVFEALRAASADFPRLVR